MVPLATTILCELKNATPTMIKTTLTMLTPLMESDLALPPRLVQQVVSLLEHPDETVVLAVYDALGRTTPTIITQALPQTLFHLTHWDETSPKVVQAAVGIFTLNYPYLKQPPPPALLTAFRTVIADVEDDYIRSLAIDVVGCFALFGGLQQALSSAEIQRNFVPLLRQQESKDPPWLRGSATTALVL